ncbi:MAG: glycoside hydrolase family 3 N-terminal domain-containing protein [bacterium]|nr:glycoside hydrolase family 3 N-terminal domain-containing protein [bacterium]
MGKKLEEMCRLVTGHGAWHIGDIQVADGPHGVRAQEDGARNNDSYEATCFPTASSVACSWNRELIGNMARGIAQEAKELGISVVLGPGVNIKRSPLCGRNFEYYSEDPYLSGELAVSYINAMQECGVGTSLKHFAGNNQETHRMTSNSMIDERALHEIYLSAFEKAVKDAKPATVMASYNYLNGVPACENSSLLTDILRKKWGYDGLVMSDWGACVDLPACIEAGMDVEMPDSCGNHYADIVDAVKSGRLSKEALERAVEKIETTNHTYKGYEIVPNKKRVSKNTREKNHYFARIVEEESAVLLKNDGFLPLTGVNEILIIGDLAWNPRIQGGGSSHINTMWVDYYVDQFKKYGVRVRFVRGYKGGSFKREERLEKEAIQKVQKAKEENIPILFFGGLTEIAEGEGYDRDRFRMPVNQSFLLEQLLEITDQIAFISVSGSPYDMEYPSKCKALLQLYLGGEAVASACVRIVLGMVNPSGKLAESIPYSEKEVPSYGYFGRQGEQSRNLDDVEYRESIFVGYRYYDTFNVPVRYCFGHGLSYTRFKYSNLKISGMPGKQFRVTFCVENIGSCDGLEIAQVYVKNPESNAFRAKRELRGFTKIDLACGERKEVEIILDERAFHVYQDDDFQIIGGTYEIQVGASLQDIRLSEQVKVEGTEIKSLLDISYRVPLCAKDFEKIYTYPRTTFSKMLPGTFTTKNSLMQMKSYSVLARILIRIGTIYTRLMYLTKPMEDPEVQMMLGGILEGNIDSVCNQSGGIISHKMIEKIVRSANRGKI